MTKLPVFALSAALFASISVSTTAHADILFLNLHLSAEELTAAKSAANIRGERVIMLPKMDDNSWNSYQDLIEKAATYTRAARNTRDPDAATRATENAEAAQKKADEINKSFPINEQTLQDAITEAEATDRPIRSLVISGHSNGRDFWGDFSEVSSPDVAQIFAKHPKTLETLRGIFTWGCYSTTLDKVMFWKKSFPNVSVILGFGDAAPLSNTDESPGLLKDGLIKQHALAENTDADSVTLAFRGLSFEGDTNSAAAINSYYVGNGFSAVEINEAQTQCKQAQGLLSDEQHSYERYFNGDLDIPADEHHSELRSYYSNLQHYTYCHFDDFEDPTTVLSLIFFNNVLKNFGRYYLKDIQTVNQTLRAHGISDRQFLDFYHGTFTRKEVLQNVMTMEIISTGGFSDTQATQYSDLVQHMSDYVRSLTCVPSTWITETATNDERPQAPDPSCNTGNDN